VIYLMKTVKSVGYIRPLRLVYRYGCRVRVEIEYRGRKASAVDLLNTGYESVVPEIIVPVAIAEQLGIWPRLPEKTVVESYIIRLITNESFGDKFQAI